MRFKALLPLAVLLCAAALSPGATTAAAARVTVTRDTYVQPAAEFQTSLGYPDIVTVENDLIKVSSLPNRGRLLLDVAVKVNSGGAAREGGTISLLFSRTCSILPLEAPRHGYFLEFGGFYTEVPWNPRDNQPCELIYEVAEPGENGGGRLIFRSEDPATGLRMEAEVRVGAGSAGAVDVRVSLYNPTAREVVLPEFRDTVVFDALRTLKAGAGGPGASVGSAESAGSGTDAPLPPPSADVELLVGGSKFRWRDYSARFTETVDVSGLASPSVVLADRARDGPSKGLTITRSWPAGTFDAVTVTTWGVGYEDEMGAVPGFIVTAAKRGITVAPGGWAVFESRFTIGGE